MKFNNTVVSGFEAALRGMRLPMESADRADSTYWYPGYKEDEYVEIVGDDVKWDAWYIGENDKTLAKKLCDGGQPHRKFLRFLHVSVDITAPLYW